MNLITSNHLNELSIEVNSFVKSIGFDNNDIPLKIALIHSEVSEAFEAFRKDKMASLDLYAIDLYKGHDFKEVFTVRIKDTFEDEIADSIIRLLDLCGHMGIDIDKHISLKMKYNATRGYKYGGKKF